MKDAIRSEVNGLFERINTAQPGEYIPLTPNQVKAIKMVFDARQKCSPSEDMTVEELKRTVRMEGDGLIRTEPPPRWLFCAQCSHKLHDTLWKHCPECGTKIGTL